LLNGETLLRDRETDRGVTIGGKWQMTGGKMCINSTYKQFST